MTSVIPMYKGVPPRVKFKETTRIHIDLAVTSIKPEDVRNIDIFVDGGFLEQDPDKPRINTHTHGEFVWSRQILMDCRQLNAVPQDLLNLM